MQNSQKLKGKIKKIGQPTRRLYRQEQHAGNRRKAVGKKAKKANDIVHRPTWATEIHPPKKPRQFTSKEAE